MSGVMPPNAEPLSAASALKVAVFTLSPSQPDWIRAVNVNSGLSTFVSTFKSDSPVRWQVRCSPSALHLVQRLRQHAPFQCPRSTSCPDNARHA